MKRFLAASAVLMCMLSRPPHATAQIERAAIESRPDDVGPYDWHVPDPIDAVPFVEKRIEATERPADRQYLENILTRLRSIRRPRSVELSLQDALHRALANSHNIRVQSYLPAISTAGVVQAQAAFDAVYFMSLTKNVQDQPTASQLAGTKVDAFSFTGGIRKQLPTGGNVSLSMELQRNFIDFQFQIINPAYESAFVAQITQPLLRNAGVDFNRSQIEIARNDLRIDRSAFERQVRDTLFAVERAYWQLVQARRELAIRARLLSQFEKIYDLLWQRRNFDVYQIQLAQSKANLETSKSAFVQVQNQVRDAEDALIALINDPALNLIDDVEIIPTDFPSRDPLTLDPVAEVQAALDNRQELDELRMQIDNARLLVGQAKNQALPRLDLTFRYTVPGLGESFGEAVSEVSRTDFTEYFVFLDFDVPVGNRGPQAALRQARLQHAQAIAALEAQTEQVILEVNSAVRAIDTSYKQVQPNLESADANAEQVAAVVARAEARDFLTLNQELNARNALANSRSALLDTIVNYNVAIIDLERTKGTLLEYNNVQLAAASDGHD